LIFDWFNAREAVEIGAALADQLAPQIAPDPAVPGKIATPAQQGNVLEEMLQRADCEVRPRRLNFYKRAKFANSFKWRLLANGIKGEIADELTQRLVLHLSLDHVRSAPARNSAPARGDRPSSNNARYLFAQANKFLVQGSHREAIDIFQELVSLNPRHAEALNNLGSALCDLGHYKEAEDHFRRALSIKPDYPEPYYNLGTMFRLTGSIVESEIWLRRALKLKPNYADARSSLGLTLVLRGRVRDAKVRFGKVLKGAPRHVGALFGMGSVAKIEGRFDEAEAMFKRVLEINPRMTGAWAALVGLRKMTSADDAWLKRAEEIAASEIGPLEAADLCFAIGKYCDDVKDFDRAFYNYKRANELLQTVAERYERDAHTRFVDELIRDYTRETVHRGHVGASASMKPVFVVGMPRSGTSLAEQIVASHPAAKGAGELGFWSAAVHEHDITTRKGPVDESTKRKLAKDYLRALESQSGDALRVVDKTPVNSDYLGVIHAVFPNARIIYMQRDPIDTCLSCYFQQFSLAVNFTMDLSDLAHYYREHRRLMAHWRAVLPRGTILDVPYAELVVDQVGWTRKILDFLGLEWDERCLDFHDTERAVTTTSYWQVRQRIYKDSVNRWRNYEKFIGPLLGLRDLKH
jgi:tetratricopeptide (TPR) repeat protein